MSSRPYQLQVSLGFKIDMTNPSNNIRYMNIYKNLIRDIKRYYKKSFEQFLS